MYTILHYVQYLMYTLCCAPSVWYLWYFPTLCLVPVVPPLFLVPVVFPLHCVWYLLCPLYVWYLWYSPHIVSGTCCVPSMSGTCGIPPTLCLVPVVPPTLSGTITFPPSAIICMICVNTVNNHDIILVPILAGQCTFGWRWGDVVHVFHR